MFFSRKKKNADKCEKAIIERPSLEDSVERGSNVVCPPCEDNAMNDERSSEMKTEMSTEMTTEIADTSTTKRTGSSYHVTNFLETRKYLQQVKCCKERLELLGTRKSYHWITNQETESLEILVEEAQQRQLELSAEIADEISKLDDVKQEMVLTLRYIEGLTWEEIADAMALSVRTVQKLHGRGLPGMEKILVADGKIDADKVYEFYRSGYYSDGYHGDGCGRYRSDGSHNADCGGYHGDGCDGDYGCGHSGGISD